MKRVLASVCSLGLVFAVAGQAEAYESKTVATPITVTSSGVTPTQTLTANVVLQNTGSPGTAAALTWGVGGNDFRDSDRAIRVDVDTNLAANRILIYTDNLDGGAVPQAQLDTSLGNDGGGLVGVTDSTQIVPVLWGVEDANPDYNFGGTVGDNEVFITDRAHVATYVDAVLGGASAAEKQKLDTLAMKRCDNDAPVANADNAGTAEDPERYPQLFGDPGVFDSDLCNDGGDITIDGTFIAAGAKVPFAEELSKNIAVLAFGCLGTSCTAPDLSTPSPADSKAVVSPFFVPLAADFRFAPGQDYSTNTLTVELVTQ